MKLYLITISKCGFECMTEQCYVFASSYSAVAKIAEENSWDVINIKQVSDNCIIENYTEKPIKGE